MDVEKPEIPFAKQLAHTTPRLEKLVKALASFQQKASCYWRAFLHLIIVNFTVTKYIPVVCFLNKLCEGKACFAGSCAAISKLYCE